MKYIGKFRDRFDALHTVTITTKNGIGSKIMVLCTSPFIEELEGSDNSIFKPCKYSSATVRVLAKDYMFNIYQSKAQEVRVVLTDENGKVEWTGFVTPNLYDMGFESDKEELEIECQDALSTLQYFKYKVVDTKPKTQSFLAIIKNILKSKTPYKAMYFPSYLENISLDKLKISEQNFMDEDGDDWTMQDVLEEICRYLNVTCVASGDEVWFINYASLGKVMYTKYGIQTNAQSVVSSSNIKKDSCNYVVYSSAGCWQLLCQLQNDAEAEIKMYIKHDNTLIWQEMKFFVTYKNGIGAIYKDVENKGDITYGYFDTVAVVRSSDGQAYIQWRGNANRYDYANIKLLVSYIGTGITLYKSCTAGDLLDNWQYSSYVNANPDKTTKGDESDVSYADYLKYKKEECYEVDANSYSENGGKISLLPSYNQISVVSKINEYSDLLPDVFDEKYLTNANGNWNTVLPYVLDGASINRIKGVLGRYRFVTNPHYKTYYYNKDTAESVDMATAKSYSDLQSYIGATLLQASFEEYNAMNIDSAFCPKTDKSLTNYILIHQHDKQSGLKVFSTVVSDIPETFLGKNTKMVIKGSALFMDRSNWMYIPTSYGNKKDDFDRRNLYLECKLKWGKYYFHNYRETITSNSYRFTFSRSGYWSTEEGTFRLFFYASDTKHINNKDYSVLDTSGDYSVSGIPSGYVIPLPESATVQGSIPEFEIYTRGRIDGSYRLDAIWLKNFGIELAIGQDSNVKDDDWQTDTEYTNIINEEYIEEADDVECKINTWDNKAPTYSVVLYDDGKNQSYLDEVKNLVSGETHRLEEHIIYDFVNQYKQPSIQLELNLKERLMPTTVVTVPILDKDKKFIVDSYSRDYYNCSNNIKLIEKWTL